MSPQDKDIVTLIPDLRNISQERLTELGNSVLAESIALHQKRVKENAAPLNSFNARI